MDKKLREDVADVLQDFVAVLTEATSDKISLPPDTQCWEWEAYVMRRLSPLIARLRKGKSLEPWEAYRRDRK